jgi:hypothetical protein
MEVARVKFMCNDIEINQTENPQEVNPAFRTYIIAKCFEFQSKKLKKLGLIKVLSMNQAFRLPVHCVDHN